MPSKPNAPSLSSLPRYREIDLFSVSSEPSNSTKGLEILGLRDAKKIVQLMRLLVSGKIGFAFPEQNGIIGLSSNPDRLNIKSFTQRCIGYLCSAIKMLTHNDPDTYTEIMRLCSEVSDDFGIFISSIKPENFCIVEANRKVFSCNEFS